MRSRSKITDRAKQGQMYRQRAQDEQISRQAFTHCKLAQDHAVHLRNFLDVSVMKG
jgi:hypothetical protein